MQPVHSTNISTQARVAQSFTEFDVNRYHKPEFFLKRRKRDHLRDETFGINDRVREL